MLDNLSNIGYNKNKIKIIKSTIDLRYGLIKKDLKVILIHPYLFIYNIIYEILDRI